MPFDALPNDVIPPRPADTVRAIVFANPFDPGDRQIIDVDWRADATVTDYLGELPDPESWEVIAAGQSLSPEDRAATTLLPDDGIVLIRHPQKGVGRILAMVAILVVATVAGAYLGPVVAPLFGGLLSSAAATSIITGAITIAGGFLVNALLPAENPAAKPGSTEVNESPSYSLDGPKPTAREDIPVPVVYGRFRVAGNRINYYAENTIDGKSQYLYLQHAVSEGPIAGVSDLLINDQPISNFQDASWDFRLGTIGQPGLFWFANTITPYAQSAVLGTAPFTYNTIEEVDAVSLSVSFPNGLYDLNKQNGERSNRQAGLFATATNVTTGQVRNFAIGSWVTGTRTGITVDQPGLALRVTARARGASGSSPRTAFTGNIALSANGSTYVQETRSGFIQNSYVADGIWSAGEEYFYFETPVLDNTALSNVWTAATSGALEIVAIQVFQSSPSVVRNERNPFNVTLNSGPLPRGRYVIRVGRTSAESTSDYQVDRAVLTTVNEIQADPYSYPRTAHYALRVRLTDQLNSEPVTSVLVQGRLVWIYDKNGAKSSFEWSDNPADIALDIMLSDDWGNRFLPSRIDFAAFSRWRAFCAAEGLRFNGVFDYLTTTWDALNTVMRVGRASPLPSGTRWSVAIEGPSEPVMMFGDQNIIKGTFESFWVGRAGRSNLVEVQYYDENDGFRRNSAFARDDASFARGDALKQSTVNLIGVTSAEQAQKEANFQVRLNYYIVQGCRFRAGYEAMGCMVGDVIYVQHSMPKWGWASRLTAVSGSSLTIDSDIDTEGTTLPDGDWRILVVKPALLRSNRTIQAVSGSQVRLNGAAHGTVRRLVMGGRDYRVTDVSVVDGNTVYSVEDPTGLSAALVGQQAALYDIDAMLEGTIAKPAANSSAITLTSWTHGVQPEAGDQVMIGRIDRYKKPFRIVKFGHSSDGDRTIECLEYLPEVYGTGPLGPIPNYSEIPSAPLHVLNLRADQITENVQGGGVRYYARALWDRPLNDLRGHRGAAIYVSVNDGEFAHVGTALDGRQDWLHEAPLGTVVRFKVVAIDGSGFRAPWRTAPVATVTIGRRTRRPSAPTNLGAVGSIKLISVSWAIPADADIRLVEVWENTTNILGSAYQVDEGFKRFYTRTNLSTNETRFYWVRSLSYAGEYSAFVGPVSATTSPLLTDDIGNAIITTAKFAQGIAPVQLIDGLIGPAPDGTVAVNTQDGKLYVREGGSWATYIQPLGPNGTLSDAQLAGLSASKLVGQITGAQITDQAITDTKLAVGSTGNQIWNPTCFADVAGWVSPALTAGQTATLTPALFSDGASWGLSTYGSGKAFCASAPNWCDIGWRPQGARVPVTPNKRYEWQVKLAIPSNTSARLFITWVSETGTNISSVSTTLISGTALGQANRLSDYVLRVLFANAPANAAFAVPYIRMYGPNAGAGTNIALFWTQALFGEAMPNQTQASPWAAGGVTVVDGAIIRTRTLAANRLLAQSITADELAAASVTTEKLAVGPASGNVIWNSCCAHNRAGWFASGFAGNFEAPTGWGAAGDGLNFADNTWRAVGVGTGGFWKSGVLAANRYIDMQWRGHADQWTPIVGGQWYEWQARVQAHRCRLRLVIAWYDGGRNYVGEQAVDTVPFASANGYILGNFKPLWLKAQAPANAAFAIPTFRMLGQGGDGTASGANPYVFFTQAQFTDASSTQLEAKPWSPGGITEINGGMIRTNSIVTENLAAGIITADKMAVNSVVAGTIAAGAVNTQEIAAGAIKAGLLASEELIVQNAQIGNLVVGNRNVSQNAVSNVTYGAWDGQWDPGDWTGFVTVGLFNDSTYFGAEYLLDVSVIGDANEYFGSLNNQSITAFALISARVVRTGVGVVFEYNPTVVTSCISFPIREVLGGGYHQYEIQCRTSRGGTQPQIASRPYVKRVRANLTMLKR